MEKIGEEEAKNDKKVDPNLGGEGRLGVKINCTSGSIDPENLYNYGLIQIIKKISEI